ncbi:unnamed protein product [Effrenium voratum]|nr:unnamed protein product [Effrenium voratum]
MVGSMLPTSQACSKSVFFFQVPGHARPCSMVDATRPKPASPAGRWQRGQQMMNIATSLFSWGLGWHRIIFNAARLQDKYDIKYAAPLAVLLLGVVMTSVLGVLDFFHEGQHSLVVAALDADTPYLAAVRCPQLLRGEEAPD